MRNLLNEGKISCVLAALVAWAVHSSSVNAQTPPVNHFTPNEIATGSCWIDSATGKRVNTYPAGFRAGLDDPDHFSRAGNSDAGVPTKNFVRTSDGSWINSATGEPVSTYPAGFRAGLDDPVQFSRAGNSGAGVPTKNFVKVPCPPPPNQSAAAPSAGLYLGGELVKNWGWVRSTERSAATGAVTNQFSDRADPFGGGIIVGYKFSPWANSIVVSPFASLDFIRAPVNHTFPGGSYLGTTDNFIGTGGIKIGPRLDMGVWLYGIAGVSVLNETLKINFIPVLSTQSATVAGATVGFGGAMQPAFLQGLGHPVSLFLEYQHTWWQDATFNTPAASPGFNYTFRREDDVVKFGFTVSLDPPPTPTHSMVFKAPPLK